MNIGIDVDGVLTDIQGFNLKHAPPFFKKKFKRDVADKYSYDIRDIFKCSEVEYKAYWKKYLLKYVLFKPVRNGAKEVINQLRKDGHTVIIITKRVFTCNDDFRGRLMRLLIKNWLWRNGIKYDDIVFCDNDILDSKLTACMNKKIDVMIDDEPININAIAPIAKVICFSASYNCDCEGENVFHAGNWNEVYYIVERKQLL